MSVARCADNVTHACAAGHRAAAAPRAGAPTHAQPCGERPRARIIAAVSSSLTPREEAAQGVAALVTALAAEPSTPVGEQLIELADHLERAIRAFHMEAIRFRAFTMSRLIKQHQAALPPELPGRMEAILHALEAAGFQTRSVTA